MCLCATIDNDFGDCDEIIYMWPNDERESASPKCLEPDEEARGMEYIKFKLKDKNASNSAMNE